MVYNSLLQFSSFLLPSAWAPITAWISWLRSWAALGHWWWGWSPAADAAQLSCSHRCSHGLLRSGGRHRSCCHICTHSWWLARFSCHRRSSALSSSSWSSGGASLAGGDMLECLISGCYWSLLVHPGCWWTGMKYEWGTKLKNKSKVFSQAQPVKIITFFTSFQDDPEER